ncbi:MAG: hypothetical protein H0T51_13640, partial [Pirellulales bacterium]|nr:hypothetical protein [Pirellulales bacterium]
MDRRAGRGRRLCGDGGVGAEHSRQRVGTMSALGYQHLGRGRLLAVAVVLSTLASGMSRESIAAEAANYRRVFVPVDRPEEWPTDGKQYLPVDREEFERHIKTADERRQLAELGGVQLVKSRYTASLDEQSTLIGQAALEVKLVDESPRVLPLSPLNVAVTGARWMDADSGADQSPALIGVWERSSADPGEYGVLVPKSGELLVDWSARSQSSSTTELEYRLQLPTALQRELLLELPADYTPTMAGAHLAKSEPLDAATAAGKRWTFGLGAAAEHRLQIRRRTAAAPRESSLPLAANAEAYGLTPQGLTYEAELRVQTRAAAVNELRLAVPASMQIAEVLVDRAAVEFQQDEKNVDTLVVPLPKTSSPITVTIRGVAEIVLDKPWPLPSVTAKNAFWTEGTSTLWIDPALELQSITPRAASLLNSVGVGSLLGGEAHRLQAWSSDAGAEIIVAARRGQLHVESGVVAEFADRELAGRCQARLWTTGGAALQVTAALEPDWDLESIEAMPADAVEQWHVAGEGRQRKLHVQLRRSPTELAPVRLTINARKPLRAWAPVATLRELDWIRFPGVDATSGHLLVRDRRGDELLAEQSAVEDVVALTSLPPTQRDLFGETLTGLLFAAGRMKHDATIRVVSTPPRFTGEAWIELTRSDVGFEHNAEIVCRPIAGAVSEFMVNAAHALPADAHWSLVGGETPPVVELVTSTPPPPAERGAAPAARMQQYRVRFSQPQSGEFRLRATWRGETVATDSVNSLTLPGAESWQSWAIVRGDPATVTLDPRGCQPSAASPDGRDDPEAPGVLGSYRLGDDPATPLVLTPMLTATASPGGGAQGDVTCWLCDVTTLQFADGNQTHRLAYHLEAHDADAVELTLPTGFDFVSARM